LPRAPTPAPTAPPERDAEGLNARAVFGIVAVSVGGAALLAGSIVAAVAAAKYGDLDCPDDVCPDDLVDDMASYNDLRIPSGVTIAVGGLVTFIGSVFLANGLTDEKGYVALEVGPGTLGVEGRF
jgi:hypothetical protein